MASADTTPAAVGAGARPGGASAPRVALVHDWLTGMRGGERCLEVFCELFPEAPLFTLLHVPGSVSPVIERRRVITSFIQRLPGAVSRYRQYLPLFPAAVRGFDLSGFDLVISLSHSVAKAVRRPADALHICYCFSPMRYVWDLYDDYFGPRAPRLTRWTMPPVAAALRAWDRRTGGVDVFLAISHHIAERIRRVYGRGADVIHPPVDVARFRPAARVEDFYLVVSALVPYKRVDLAVAAAGRLGRRLVVVGTGPEERRLRASAGAAVQFLGWRSDAEVADLYARCRGGGFRHRAAGGGGGGAADHRPRPRRRARDDGGRPRLGCAADRRVLHRADGGRARRRHPDLRARRAPVRARRAARARRRVRPAGLPPAHRGLRGPALGGIPREARVLKAHSRVFEHLMLALDLVIVAGCWLFAYGLRFHVFGHGNIPPFRDYLLQLVPILAVWGVAFKTFNLYRPYRFGSRLSEWKDIGKASTVGALVLVAIMSFVFRGYDYSRAVILIFWIVSIAAAYLGRQAFREALRVARRRGYNQRYAVVVGGGEPAAEIMRVLQKRRDVGIRVLGILGDKLDGTAGAPWLGAPEDIRAVLDTRPVDIVIIALPHAEYARLAGILNEIGDDPVTIHLVPDVFSVALRGGVEEFETVPIIHLRESPLDGWNRILKRVCDVALGTVALGLMLPVMLVIALAIRLGSPGAILYRQERMGIDGRRFGMLKFRTMGVDAEADTGPRWAIRDDPRRTRVGVFLRRTSLDELPQLLNVLRGDMSLVGPRPERPSFVEEFRRRVPRYMLRHKVKAGITGWAQINGWRGNTSIEERIKCDLYYIENWSMSLDLKILLQTLWLGFRNRNAY